MGRRGSHKNKNIRRLTRMGAGKAFGITLPVEVIRRFRWRESQLLELVIDDRKKAILVRDFRR